MHMAKNVAITQVSGNKIRLL